MVILEKCKESHARSRKPRLRIAPFVERDVLFIENPIIEFRHWNAFRGKNEWEKKESLRIRATAETGSYLRRGVSRNGESSFHRRINVVRYSLTLSGANIQTFILLQFEGKREI